MPDQHRPIKSRADLRLSRLESCLEQTLWSADEAVMILAGVDPESQGETGGGAGRICYHYVPLPGAMEQYSGVVNPSIETFGFHMNIQAQFEYLRGFIRGVSQTPQEWIEYAAKKDYLAPWQRTAESENLINKTLTISQRKKEARRAGGLQISSSSSQRVYKIILLKDWDKQPEHMSAREIREFKRKHKDVYCPADPKKYRYGVTTRTIDDWVADLKKEKAGEEPAKWINELRSEIARGSADEQKS